MACQGKLLACWSRMNSGSIAVFLGRVVGASEGFSLGLALVCGDCFADQGWGCGWVLLARWSWASLLVLCWQLIAVDEKLADQVDSWAGVRAHGFLGMCGWGLV